MYQFTYVEYPHCLLRIARGVASPGPVGQGLQTLGWITLLLVINYALLG